MGQLVKLLTRHHDGPTGACHVALVERAPGRYPHWASSEAGVLKTTSLANGYSKSILDPASNLPTGSFTT